MKGTVILSLTLDVSAVAIMFIPKARFGRYAKDERRVRIIKWSCAAALLIAGYLIDQYITHGS
ncbi:MAG: hypothetical protein ABSH53_01570 [Holophaga sp.]|jgi:threonine/homoserine/homoserine lactone efflux protein